MIDFTAFSSTFFFKAKNLIKSVALSEPVAIKSLVFYSKSIDQKDHLKVMSLKLNKPQLSSFLYQLV